MGCGPSGERDLPYEKVCICRGKIIFGNFQDHHYGSYHSKKCTNDVLCGLSFGCRNKSRFVFRGVVDFASRKITYSAGMKFPQLISTLYRPGPAVTLKHLKISGSLIQLFPAF